MSALSDNILTFRITKLRDEHAYTEFFKRYHPRVYRFVITRVERVEIAEDIAEEAFLRVWRQLFIERQEVTNLTALLWTITRHLVIDHFRREQARPTSALGDLAETISDQNAFLHSLESRSDLVQVKRALLTVRVEYREVFLLRYLDELEIDEISAMLGKSPGAVRVLLHRATHAIKKQLDETV